LNNTNSWATSWIKTWWDRILCKVTASSRETITTYFITSDFLQTTIRKSYNNIKMLACTNNWITENRIECLWAWWNCHRLWLCIFIQLSNFFCDINRWSLCSICCKNDIIFIFAGTAIAYRSFIKISGCIVSEVGSLILLFSSSELISWLAFITIVVFTFALANLIGDGWFKV
jgi:hypothetical protein